MNITPAQAAAALADIQQTERHSREMRNYQYGSPHLIMWGVIVMAGYLIAALTPYGGRTWIVLDLLGIAGGFLIGQQQWKSAVANPTGQAYRRVWFKRVGLTWALVLAFWFSVYAILPPQTLNQASAFPGLVFGAIYAGVGIWFLSRYLWLGLAVMALTLVGYFYAAEWFSFWMAGVYGGGLILGGLWLRKA